MDHQRIEEESIAELYATGRLSPVDEELFEEHLLECRECRERVAWADDLRDSMRTVAAEEVTRTVARTGLLAWVSRHRRPLGLGLALAAVALAALPSVWLLRDRERLRQELARATTPTKPPPAVITTPDPTLTAERDELAREKQRLTDQLAQEKTAREELAARIDLLTRPQINTALYSLGLVRGTEDPAATGNLVEVGASPEWLVLEIELPASGFTTYRATLLGRGGAVLWTGDGMEPTARDTLVLSILSTLLPPGDYRLRLEGTAAGRPAAPAGEIPFRVTRGG